MPKHFEMPPQGIRLTMCQILIRNYVTVGTQSDVALAANRSRRVRARGKSAERGESADISDPQKEVLNTSRSPESAVSSWSPRSSSRRRRTRRNSVRDLSSHHGPQNADVVFGRCRRRTSFTEIVSLTSATMFELVEQVTNSGKRWSLS
ncbi:hypothetical protein EVAR_77700_1 [Eumeta japonica]|uniref:Uncharacterized protein n=1 Tax=Eumeta variegata TaxID=151549 RepID=A0A4C1TD95_EUMVA|nr:hypothetical protein EVAR_77700_1 [Eumeta japonica]